MLAELVDVGALNEFVGLVARTAGRRVDVFGSNGALVAAGPPTTAFRALVGGPRQPLPDVEKWLSSVDAAAAENTHFITADAVRGGMAVLRVGDDAVGFALVGEYSAGDVPAARLRQLAAERGVDFDKLRAAWSALLPLDATPGGDPTALTRHVARLLEIWCGRDAGNRVMRDELLLMARIAELTASEGELQSILNRIVFETTQVMNCRSASLRLLNPETGELTIKAVHNLPERYLTKGRVLRGENPIDDAALRGELVYVEDARRDPRVKFKDAARREGIVSGLSAGMIYRGQRVGVLRVYTDRKMRFRRVQREMFRSIASQAAAAIVHSELMRQRLRDAEMNRQIALAGQVQARMVPALSPVHESLDIATVYETTYQVGGDFWDSFPLPDGRLAIVVADVFGKGIPASLIMASTRAALRVLSQSQADLGRIMTALNQTLAREPSRSDLVTMALAAVDPAAREIGLCSAGHEPPLLLRGGQVNRLTHGGLVLGADAAERFEEQRIRLTRDDFLLMYTDGVVEAADFSGRLFGRKRLRDALVQYGGLRPEQMLRNIVWDIRRFVGLSDQSDDLTMVGVRVK